jgi:CDGSH-type Zn-finger protein
VTTPVELTDGDGKRIEIPADKAAIFLCRCGASAKKPVCDGAHKTCGFEG